MSQRSNGAPPNAVAAKPGDLSSAKAALEAELVTLESEARALTTEMDKVTKEVEATRGELDRLNQIGHGLEVARADELAGVKSSRLDRRAEYEQAKSIVDGHLDKFRKLGVPEEELAAARKKILVRLARSAIRAGSERGAAPDDSWRLEVEKLAKLVPTAKSVATRTINALASALTTRRDEIAKKQQVIVSHRSAAQACAKKGEQISAKMERNREVIQSGAQRIADLRPRLDTLHQRIGELRAAINLLRSLMAMIRIEEEAAERRHEQLMKETEDTKATELLDEIRREAQRLEASLRESRRAQAKERSEIPSRSAHENKVGLLERALVDLRAAAQRSGATPEETQKALMAIEQVVRSTAALEGSAPSKPKSAEDR
ncbi:MAG: hypothetical protein HY791_15590 [Deltaproteobacteria bacterium]|nr:hypothetical protein [Deltaproteobacteria bacterium]